MPRVDDFALVESRAACAVADVAGNEVQGVERLPKHLGRLVRDIHVAVGGQSNKYELSLSDSYGGAM
jgi:hypothetical protein